MPYSNSFFRHRGISTYLLVALALSTIHCGDDSGESGANTTLGGNEDEDIVLSCEETACGCDNPDCESDPIGRGVEGRPFDIEEDPSSGVEVSDDDGALVLSSRRVANEYLWAANTAEGTLSKISTVETDAEGHHVELARYAVGPTSKTGDRSPGAFDADDYFNLMWDGEANAPNAGRGADFYGEDPSRTAVCTNGVVCTANRSGGRVTCVAPDPIYCEDKNGDGLQTSDGPDNVLPFDMDDCVLWSKSLGTDQSYAPRLRGAACEPQPVIDGGTKQSLWVGDSQYRAANGKTRGTLWKLDVDDGGNELFRTQIDDCQPYGLAASATKENRNLWVSCRVIEGGSGISSIGRLDTDRCTGPACLAEETCVVGEDPDCDAAIKQRITLPAIENSSGQLVREQPYGITTTIVDDIEHVWITTSNGSVPGGVYRYIHDPRIEPDDRWARLDTGENGNGIAIDNLGFVYAALGNAGVAQIDSRTFQWNILPGTADYNAKGVGVAPNGPVFVLGYKGTEAMKLTPTQTVGVVGVDPDAVIGLGRMYTYSDMTGVQTLNATNPEGFYKARFEGCENEETVWKNFVWNAEVPAGTSIIFEIRVSEELDVLSGSEAVATIAVPPLNSPIDLESRLEEADLDIENAKHLEVTATLRAERDSSRVLTPRLYYFDVGRNKCTAGPVLE